MWSADSGTNPNTELSAPRNGIVRVATATASVDHNSSGLGLLRKAGLWVRRTSTTASSVSNEIMNHEVWKVASFARNTSSRTAKVSRSNTELISPNTIMKRRISLMLQRCGPETRSGSTLSLEIAIDGTSERKLFSRICLAASGRNGSNGVASAMLIMLPKLALATPLLPFLPLAAKQILLNNFLSDLPSLAISNDTVDPERVSAPQRWNVRDIQRFMIVFGLISCVFDLLTFGVLLYIFHAGQAVFQTSWFMISLLTELAVVLVLRTRKPALCSRPSRLLLWSTLVVAAATFAVPFLGEASALFGFVPLSATELAALVLIVAAYIVATEIAKAWFFQHATAATLAPTTNRRSRD